MQRRPTLRLGARADQAAALDDLGAKLRSLQAHSSWVDPRPGDQDLTVPPAGIIAGTYARTDVARGVHKAPANELIRSIRGFELAISRPEQDILNPLNINVVRAFPGCGNRVWGARVLTSDSAWRYVSVRRLFLMIEEFIDEATQWVVFEPNDEPCGRGSGSR